MQRGYSEDLSIWVTDPGFSCAGIVLRGLSFVAQRGLSIFLSIYGHGAKFVNREKPAITADNVPATRTVLSPISNC
jgi:hypothetical protein